MSTDDPFAKFAADMSAIPQGRLPVTAEAVRQEMGLRYKAFIDGVTQFNNIAKSVSSEYSVGFSMTDCAMDKLFVKSVVITTGGKSNFSVDVLLTKDYLQFKARNSEFEAATYAHNQGRFTPDQQMDAIALIGPFLSRAFA